MKSAYSNKLKIITFLIWMGLCLPHGSASQDAKRLTHREDLPAVSKQTVLMGTDIAAIILTEDKAKAHQAIAAAFKEIKRIEDLMTDWKPTSQLDRINQMAGLKPVKTDPELLWLLNESKKISQKTHGLFDVTYAPLGKLWDYSSSSPKVPSADAIGRALKLVNYQKLILDAEHETAFLKLKGMRMGLGGIAKGYAVDRALIKIQDFGFEHFAVNAGGDLKVRGYKQGNLWWVGIQDPQNKKENLALLPVSNTAVVTSGNYERFFEVGGKRYGHIINPKTGYPVSHCQSVTVMAKKTYWADALSTAVFVLGPKKGMKFLEEEDHVEGIIIDADGKMHVSSGLQGKKRQRKVL